VCGGGGGGGGAARGGAQDGMSGWCSSIAKYMQWWRCDGVWGVVRCTHQTKDGGAGWTTGQVVRPAPGWVFLGSTWEDDGQLILFGGRGPLAMGKYTPVKPRTESQGVRGVLHAKWNPSRNFLMMFAMKLTFKTKYGGINPKRLLHTS